MGLLDLRAAELSIVLADDQFVHGLNRDYRGKDKPTDVLSFSQLEEGESSAAGPLTARALAPEAAPPLGDIVISVDTACRQARRLGVEPAARMRTLLIHGMLHLLGYDHERSVAEARRMFARERELARAHGAAARGLGRGRQRHAQSMGRGAGELRGEG